MNVDGSQKETMLAKCLVIFVVVSTCLGKDYYDKLSSSFLIACHTTDYLCFKRQYKSLRDHVLLGNPQLGIDEYEPYVFQYGDRGSCVKISGIEESELVSISFDSEAKELTMEWEMPFKLEQTSNVTGKCVPSSLVFRDETEKYPSDRNYKFTGNATVIVTFPYSMRSKKRETYLDLLQEDLDVILDIPDWTEFQFGNEHEENVYKNSEWAYQIAQNVDAAAELVIPHADRFRKFMYRVPLEKYITLYPEEKYSDLEFAFNETSYVTGLCSSLLEDEE